MTTASDSAILDATSPINPSAARPEDGGCGTDGGRLFASQGVPTLQIRPPKRLATFELREVWAFRDLLWVLAARDLKLRYKQTALGVVWVLLLPLLSAGIFTFVFGMIAELPSDGLPYFVFSYAGLLGWNLFNGVLGRTSNCLVGSTHLISKVYFPRLVIPLSAIPSAMVDFGVAVGMMAVLMLIYGITPTAGLLVLPIAMVLLVGLSLAIGLVSASLSVNYRDVQFVLPVFTQLLLYASPIAYGASAVPERLRFWYHLNPLTPILETVRWSILGTATPPHWGWLAYSAVVTAVLLTAAVAVFKKMEQRFADVI